MSDGSTVTKVRQSSGELLDLRVRPSCNFALSLGLCAILAGATLLAELHLPQLQLPLHLAALGLGLHTLSLAWRRAWPQKHQLRLDELGLELRRGFRIDSAPWTSISSIVPHKQRDRYDFPGIELMVRGPSGHEHVWFDLWEIYTLPRNELAACLETWRARSLAPGRASADALAEAVVSRDFRVMAYGALAMPIVILAAMLLMLVAHF